jgi:hypothetical protein
MPAGHGRAYGGREMPRSLIDRTFGDESELATAPQACRAVVEQNADHGVTWLHSYVTLDRKRSFCVYVADSPEAVRKTARRNGLPVDRITQVEVLDPYPGR